MARGGTKLRMIPTAAQIRRFQKNLVPKDFRRAFRKINKRVFVAGIRKAFRDRQAQDGESWAPLDREYLARKKREGHRRQVLERTGSLKRAATRIGPTDGNVRAFGRKSMRSGVDLPQLGALLGDKEDPRSFLELTDGMVEDATDLLYEHIDEHVGKQVAKLNRKRLAKLKGGR